MPLFESIQNLAFFSTIRESALAYPVILATHLSCIAIFGGAILMTDLCLLGLAMTDQPASDLLVQLRNWKRIGFVVMVASGLLLAGSKAETYYANPYFHLKLVLLTLGGMHALAFRRRVHRTPHKRACVSLTNSPHGPLIGRTAVVGPRRIPVEQPQPLAIGREVAERSGMYPR
jgi:hypothetical protein